jgi:glycosyltransferase involved in cell wall biosynthesis
MNGIDIHVLSSQYGEGFPNVVAEAMACKTPCIVTNLGDAASIVGGTGWIVPIKNSNKLAKAIKQSLLEINTKKWKKRCNLSRIRIMNKFNIKKMINLYNKTWKNILIKVN